MAHALSLTDGTTTINFTPANGCMVTAYSPSTPELATQELPATARHGGDLQLINYRNVTETVELWLSAASKTALQSLIRSIETMLWRAHTRQRARTGARVYLTLQVDGEASTWRSELLSGRLDLPNALTDWPNVGAEARLFLTRRYYWEASSETAIPLTNNNGSNNTSGLNVFNANDGSGTSPTKRNNYVDIASANITGAIPAPVRVKMQNKSGSSVGYANFWMANNALGTPSALTHMIEAESADSGYGSTVASGSASGGNLRRFSLSTSEALVGRWSLAAANVVACGGRYMRLLARFLTSPGTIYVRPVLMDFYGLVILASGDEIALPAVGLDAQLRDLGSLAIPPMDYDAAFAGLKLGLYMRGAAGVTSVDLDYIQLTPTDSLRHIIQRGMTVPNNDYVVDDGIDGKTYSEESGARHPIYAPLGEPLMVFPGRDQRVIILHDTTTSVPLSGQLSIQMWYRPRRLTV